jgi:hypothetical protein
MVFHPHSEAEGEGDDPSTALGLARDFARGGSERSVKDCPFYAFALGRLDTASYQRFRLV